MATVCYAKKIGDEVQSCCFEAGGCDECWHYCDVCEGENENDAEKCGVTCHTTIKSFDPDDTIFHRNPEVYQGVSTEVFTEIHRHVLKYHDEDRADSLCFEFDGDAMISKIPDNCESVDPGVRVDMSHEVLFAINTAETTGEAIKTARNARSNGDLEIKPKGLVMNLKFSLAGFAYDIGTSLGLIDELSDSKNPLN